MPDVEVTLPDRLHSEIERLGEQEFLNREEAIEELLTSGIRAYQSTPRPDEDDEPMGEELWNAEESDPGGLDETGDRDEYSF